MRVGWVSWWRIERSFISLSLILTPVVYSARTRWASTRRPVLVVVVLM